MFWIALQARHESQREAWGWRALQFAPRVALLDEAVVLEAAASERLWGGRRRLLRRLFASHEALEPPGWATGATARVALALLRLRQAGAPVPESLPDDLPLHTLSAARPHLAVLERIGCRTWAELRALPAAGVARRFGAGLVAELERACGLQPEAFAWLTLPEAFDLRLELPALAQGAPELMWTGQRLLAQLQLWLQARHLGVLALELEWTLDLKRLDGRLLPPQERLEIRTAQPTQDMAHLRRLLAEHLARATLAAPANHLRLRSLQTVPWGGATTSLLPGEQRAGEQLHQLVERLSVRLGEARVQVPVAAADHRPERMQSLQPARRAPPAVADPAPQDALYPPWLLPQPQLLEVRGAVPQYGGPLRRLARLHRIETGWWEEGGPALRDYFIARSESAGLVWIFRERPASTGGARWFLHGFYG